MTKFILLFLFVLTAQAEVKFPPLDSPVVDQVGLLSSQEKYELETWLYRYRQSGKAQIQVVIVPDLHGLPIEQYSIKLVEAWKLGGAKRDDGVLFIVSTGDRKMRIEVGQGLEGALTDLQSKRILDDRVRPLFKSRQYAAGIAAGVSEILQAVDPEYVNTHQEESPQWQDKTDNNKIFFYILLFLFVMSFLGRRRRRSGLLPFLGGWAGGSTFGGGWGGGRSGGGWSGGGGGFSGGGASSDW